MKYENNYDYKSIYVAKNHNYGIDFFYTLLKIMMGDFQPTVEFMEDYIKRLKVGAKKLNFNEIRHGVSLMLINPNEIKEFVTSLKSYLLSEFRIKL
jgi:hypothetical protein